MKLFLVVLVLIGQPALSLDEEWRVQTLNLQYQDFFARLKQEEAYDERRQAAAAEVKEQREAWDEQMNRARIEYSKNRKAPPDMSGAFKEWSQAQELWIRKNEKSREEYVEVKNHVQELMSHAKRIPGNLEYDLDP